jgi:hypothetical protein
MRRPSRSEIVSPPPRDHSALLALATTAHRHAGACCARSFHGLRRRIAELPLQVTPSVDGDGRLPMQVKPLQVCWDRMIQSEPVKQTREES